MKKELKWRHALNPTQLQPCIAFVTMSRVILFYYARLWSLFELNRPYVQMTTVDLLLLLIHEYLRKPSFTQVEPNDIPRNLGPIPGNRSPAIAAAIEI